MRFDGMNTMEGRHLVFAYAAVILLQGGYFLYVLRDWLRFGRLSTDGAAATQKKATKSAQD